MFSIEDMVKERVRGSVKRVKEERAVSWRWKCCCTGISLVVVQQGKGQWKWRAKH
jgi:hypothetical protein